MEYSIETRKCPYCGEDILATAKVCILLSGFYAFIGFKIGAFFFSNEAGWVIAILVGIGSLGINLSSRKWLKDF